MRIAGVSVDGVEKLLRFRDEFSLRFPLVGDIDRSIGGLYGTLKGGRESAHERDTLLIGPDGTVLLAYQRVRAAGHAARVLADTGRLREEGRI